MDKHQKSPVSKEEDIESRCCDQPCNDLTRGVYDCVAVSQTTTRKLKYQFPIYNEERSEFVNFSFSTF